MLKLNKSLRRGNRHPGKQSSRNRNSTERGKIMSRAIDFEETVATPLMLLEDQDDMAGRKRNKKDTQDVPQIDKEWFAGRMRALRIPSMAQIARDIGIEKAMYTRSLQGTRLFTVSDILGLSRVLNAPIEEVCRRIGFQVPRKGVPIVGVVRDGGKISTVSQWKGKVFELPDPPPNAKALIGEFRETKSSYDCDGATFVYSEAEDGNPVPIGAFGQLCVVEAEGYTTPVLGVIVKGQGRGRIAIRLFGSDKVDQLETVYRISPVLSIIFP